MFARGQEESPWEEGFGACLVLPASATDGCGVVKALHVPPQPIALLWSP